MERFELGEVSTARRWQILAPRSCPTRISGPLPFGCKRLESVEIMAAPWLIFECEVWRAAERPYPGISGMNRGMSVGRRDTRCLHLVSSKVRLEDCNILVIGEIWEMEKWRKLQLETSRRQSPKQ
jgi:hypothetical protein